jgi:hypothetical protein
MTVNLINVNLEQEFRGCEGRLTVELQREGRRPKLLC